MTLKTTLAAAGAATALVAAPASLALAHDGGGHRHAVELRSSAASPLTVASLDGNVLTLAKGGRQIAGTVDRRTRLSCRTAVEDRVARAHAARHGGRDDDGGSGSGRDDHGGGRHDEPGDDHGAHGNEQGDDHGGDVTGPTGVTGPSGPTGVTGPSGVRTACPAGALAKGATVRQALRRDGRWVKIELLVKATR